ncbi:MAG: DUF21 domain-containing protein [Aureliella sp.]
MTIAILLIVLGIGLSAFFSGSETGFYRVTRVRLAIDAKSGRILPRALHWLVSRASLVVATVLIGNNIANYVVSLGLVLFTGQILAPESQLASAVPLLMTPILFVYGELLPKFLFYQAPYRLLRMGAPLMLMCTVLFLPASIFVLLLEAVWSRLMGRETTAPAAARERQELQRVLVEGQEAGVVLPVQRELAQNLFTYGGRPIRAFATPIRALPVVQADAMREEILRVAAARGQRIVGVATEDGKQLLGCYLVSELLLSQESFGPKPQAVGTARATETSIQVLTRMQSQQCSVVQVFDANQTLLGIVTKERLTSLLLSQA